MLEDAPRIAELIAPWEVVRWLTGAPFPYRLADGTAFAARAAKDAGEWAITTRAGDFLGIITLGTRPSLGYWLGQPYWGRGYMSEGVTAVLGAHFTGGGATVISGYLPGNTRSARLLQGLGFTKTHIETISGPKGDERVQRMSLSADAWRLRRARQSRIGAERG